ncbi:MAG: DEAD/DEAH box helicase family protein [Deltaproteobacteria bacterium]|nr:DEAD/DEAH box helicase family protein [Deltaproteobacteria bacterium]
MKRPLVNRIAQSLSLRPPQRRSLEILARSCELVPLGGDVDLDEALAALKAEFPHFEGFDDRTFPSLCFALATGVGKTRLMGAFIAYLALGLKIRHFFVLAPNLTIYEKLKTDFTPNTPKYVFQGIGELITHPPVIVTGDDYDKRPIEERAAEARERARAPAAGPAQIVLDVVREGIVINIFNISKFNREATDKQGAPRMRRLSEYLGQSYFDYLSRLDDLVLLMDESHRYRADAGVKALNELNPVIGLELTATPQVESGKSALRFKNVIYDYPLSAALNDGFVKEPAVATRENFDASLYKDREEALERLKLEDAVRVHEDTKIDLELYHRDKGAKRVKPFILVIAKDTDHAGELEAFIKSDAFFGGRYADKVIQVHSQQRGAEKDENVSRLLAVESPDEPTEIVIHVNMLKEGWDVTNLYTIVPLRAANSKTLIEQSIGRGLRLPFGERVRDRDRKSLDRLTIIAHDKFQEIVDEANKPDSVIRAGIVIGGAGQPGAGKVIVTSPSAFESMVLGSQATELGADGTEKVLAAAGGVLPPSSTPPLHRHVAAALAKVATNPSVAPTVTALEADTAREAVKREVRKAIAAVQPELALDEASLDVAVNTMVKAFQGTVIGIPRISVFPKGGQVTSGYDDFDLDLSAFGSIQPVAEAIRIQSLHDGTNSERLVVANEGPPEEQLEHYIIRHIIDYDDVNETLHMDLIGKLAEQAVQYIRDQLNGDEAGTAAVVRAKEKELAQFIHGEMNAHYWEEVAEYQANVHAGMHYPKAVSLVRAADAPVRSIRDTLDAKSGIRDIVFTGFKKCMFQHQKFESNPERILALVLEGDGAVEKWVKPTAQDIHLTLRGGSSHLPDFVVETADCKYLVEVKRHDMLDQRDVVEKASACVAWCKHATAHETAHDGGKRWAYVIIPDEKVSEASTLGGLAAKFTKR